MQKLKIEQDIYAWRRRIETVFCKLQESKRIAMLACKADRSFAAMTYLVSASIDSR